VADRHRRGSLQVRRGQGAYSALDVLKEPEGRKAIDRLAGEALIQDRYQPGDEPVHVGPRRVMNERGAHDAFGRLDA
jgi:hypothetical protein